MSEQEMAWAFGLLTLFMMVAGAVWLWSDNRTSRSDSPIGPATDSTAGEDAKSQALVRLTSGSQDGGAMKAGIKKPPKAHSAANCPLCRAEGLGSGANCGHRNLRVYDDGTQRKLVPYWMLKSSQGRPKRSNTEGAKRVVRTQSVTIENLVTAPSMGWFLTDKDT